MNTIPDGLPTLSSGAHKPGDGKACVMEYVALLAGEQWTDMPSCTHPALAKAAQNVNDHLPDAERYRLVPLIGRLFGTGRPNDEAEDRALSVALARWCAEDTKRSAADAANAAYAADAANAANAAYAAANAAANAAYAADAANSDDDAAYAARIEFLTRLLDEYDRITGRTTHREITTAELLDLARQVTA